MKDFGWRLSDLLFKLRIKQERIDALESGEELIRLKEKNHKELAYQDGIIKQLQKTIAEKDRQIIENRKNWEQVHDDIKGNSFLQAAFTDHMAKESHTCMADLRCQFTR